MRRPAALELLLLGLVALALSAPAANAALRGHTTRATTYSKGDVVRAFQGVKIKLVSTIAGNESQYVTALTAVASRKLTHTNPWAVAVWIYENEALATQAYNSGVPLWRANGIASDKTGNVVVTVVPKGREIGAEGPAFPMPVIVRHALTSLKHR
jgi:hypothetical protein